MKKSKTKKIIAATIGLGFGMTHVECLKKNKFVNLKFICDKKQNMSRLSSLQNLNFLSNPSEIWKNTKIDLVTVASYDNFHYQQILNSIKNHKHVFSEKPFCQTKNEFIKIKNSLRKYKVKFSSNFVLRHHPKFKKVKDLVEKKIIGKIYNIEGEYNYGRIEKLSKGWRGKIPFYSIVQGGGIHIIDLMIWMLKSYPLEVISTGNKLMTQRSIFKFNDNNIALINFKNGAIGKVSSNFGCVAPHQQTLKIYGSKGTIEVDREKIKIYKSRNEKQKPKEIYFRKINKNYKKQILNSFIKSIKMNKSVQNPNKDEILKSMATCISIEKSAKTKKWEKIN